MAKTTRRLSVMLLALVLALSVFPVSVRADEWDGSYDDYWYEDTYEEYAYESSWTDAYYEGSWVLGVDVSEWNGTIDWETVQDSGVGFAIIKCGGSDDWWGCYEDERFLENALECERLGIPYGVYFYSTAQSAWYASVEADYICSLLSGYGLHPDLPVFLDMECSDIVYRDYDDASAILNDVSYSYCAEVESWGYEPGLYASSSWWEYLMDDELSDRYACWVAQYDGSLDYACDCWQYSADGEVWGIDWPVDLNIWFV